MNKDDGGFAFPCESHFSDGTPNGFNPGMTLRDYLAAKSPIRLSDAMYQLGLYAESIGCFQAEQRLEILAKFAEMQYEYADAMIAERAK